MTNLTASQKIQITLIESILISDWGLSSKFVALSVEKTDPFTKSVFIRLNFQNGHCFVYVGTNGGVRDIDGKNLKKGGRIQRLPKLIGGGG